MKVIKIEAKSLPQIAVCKKVVAYCRVSTLQEIQYHSLEAQQQYYQNAALLPGASGQDLQTELPLWLIGHATVTDRRKTECWYRFRKKLK